MERAITNAPFTTRLTVYAGSTATDPSPDSATIHVLRADGTTLIPAGTNAINDTATGPGIFAFAFTATQMDRLDILECRWTVAQSGAVATFRTYIEVAGGYLCTLADMKASFPSDTDTQLAARRTAAEINIERACGQAFVPRLSIERRQSGKYMRLIWPNVRAFRYGLVGDSPLTPAQVETLGVTAGGRLYGMPYTYQRRLVPLVVAYEHGMDFVPDPIRSATAAIAQQISSAASTADVNANRIIRREADNQVVAYATPSATSSSTAATISPLLAQVARDYHRPLVA